MNARYRPVAFAVTGLLLAWLISWGGFHFARESKMTAEKVAAFVSENDLSKLSGSARQKALQELADKLNALSAEERRKARGERLWASWFEQMTEEEKGRFIEDTMPAGTKQMLEAFEKLPEEKRRKAVDDAVKRLREQGNSPSVPGGLRADRDGRQQLSPELQKKAVETGLKTFFTQSSAQTKAELAPLMEEIQRAMETGRMFR